MVICLSFTCSYMHSTRNFVNNCGNIKKQQNHGMSTSSVVIREKNKDIEKGNTIMGKAREEEGQG